RFSRDWSSDGALPISDVVVDQPVQVVIRPNTAVVVRLDAEPGIQQRVVVGNPRFGHRFLIGPTVAARVGQLQADQEVVGVADLQLGRASWRAGGGSAR